MKQDLRESLWHDGGDINPGDGYTKCMAIARVVLSPLIEGSRTPEEFRWAVRAASGLLVSGGISARKSGGAKKAASKTVSAAKKSGGAKKAAASKKTSAKRSV